MERLRARLIESRAEAEAEKRAHAETRAERDTAFVAGWGAAVDAIKARAEKAEQQAADRQQMCNAVHTEPLLEAVLTAGLTVAETEGPSGGGGIDHAHTIALMGKLIVETRAERDVAVRLLSEAVEDTECDHYDHHGVCQTHGMSEAPCVVAEVRDFLAARSTKKEGT
jgi:hypothetical protein